MMEGREPVSRLLDELEAAVRACEECPPGCVACKGVIAIARGRIEDRVRRLEARLAAWALSDFFGSDVFKRELLARRCVCGHVGYGHTSNGRCRYLERHYPCSCQMFDPAETHS